jgi:hypothetical protein
MFITKTALPRRTFLRGLGATVALPLLDAMLPAGTALAQTAAAPRQRAGFIYIPHGADMASWTPAAAGTGFELSPTLKTLEPFKDSLVVVSNLRRAGGQSAMHAAAACGWLSGATPKRTEAEDYESGTTIDQVLARRLGDGIALSVARVRDGRLHRVCGRLYTQLQLRLSELDLVVVTHDAAADGDQSTRGVRAVVRRWRNGSGAPSRPRG